MRNFRFSHDLILAVAVLLLSVVARPLRADVGDGIDGFSEPYRTVKTAASESGTMAETLVREGQAVKKGDVLARLDTRLHQSLVDIAKANMDSRSEHDAAIADHKWKKQRWETIVELQRKGHASDEEVLRTAGELEIAAVGVRSAEEKQVLRKLEYQKLATQLDMLQIRSPVTGVVTQIHKQPGEYVGPNDPVAVTVVQLDVLSVSFLFPRETARRLTTDATATVRFLDSQRDAAGTIELVSPVANAESNTVTVRVRIDNAAGRYSAGERCRFLLPGDPVRTTTSTSTATPARSAP